MLKLQLEYKNIPQFLKELHCWNIADYRKNKAPEDINGNIRGYNIKYQVSFEAALKASIEQYKMLSFGINKENRTTWIDLDYCFNDNGVLKEWAKKIIKFISKLILYCEKSISKRGLHILIKEIHFEKNISIKMNKIMKNETEKSGIEIYSCNKNLALTGWKYEINTNNNDNCSIESFKKQIKEYQDIIQKQKEEKYKNNTNNQKYTFETNVFEEIKNRLNIKSTLESYGVKFNYQNKALCPFHKEKTPSFTLNNDTYHCYGCGEHGDVIQFTKDYFKLSNLDAIKKLNSEFNLNIDIKFNPIKKPVISVDNSVDNSVDKSIYDYITELNNWKGKLTFKEDIPFDDNKKYYLDKNLGIGYYLTKRGFINRFINNGQYQDKIITPVILLPENLIYLNKKEELLLTAHNNKHKEKNIFMTNKAFTSTLNFRMFLSEIYKRDNWFDGKTNDVIAYNKYISSLINYMKLERVKATDKLGWNSGEFLPYSNKVLLVNNNLNEMATIDSIHTKGSYEIWQNYILACLDNDIFRLYMTISLASPLIGLLNLQGFGLYNFAPPSRGKTIASYCAYSIWGKPGKQSIPAFNANRAGIESRLAILNNLPAIWDDSQHLDSFKKKDIEKIIYDMANGSGKTRMTKDIKAREVLIWDLTFILTGERELLDKSNDSGAYKRLLEINGAPMSGKFFARETKMIIMENYGFLGPKFIEIIKKIGKKDLLKQLNTTENKLYNKNNIEDHITHLSIITTCSIILNKLLELEDDSINWAKRILKLLPTKKSIDKIQFGLDIIKETYFKNELKFNNEKILTPKIGFRTENGIAFYRNEFSKILNEYDIPEKQFTRYIKNNDLVELDAKGNFRVIKTNGKSCRPIIFKHDFFINDPEEEKYDQQNLFDNNKDE